MSHKNQKFSFAGRIKSFKYAFEGLWYFVKNDHNGRLHLVAAVLAIGISWYLKIAAMEWVAILSVITLVIAAEIFNSSIEKLADVVSTEYHPKIKVVKDLAAAGVVLMAFLAIVVGAIVFLPKLFC